jgi:hypothetical protein
MQQLALADFSHAVGETYSVDVGDGAIELILESAEELPPSGRAEGSFRLDFRGPADPVLPQAIYRFRYGDFSADIFIVPIGRSDKGALYEAIFF